MQYSVRAKKILRFQQQKLHYFDLVEVNLVLSKRTSAESDVTIAIF